MQLLPCANDLAFDPISSCRAFDFTITFESYILSLLPSAVLIVFGALRLFWLRTQPYQIPHLGKSSALARTGYAIKMVTALSCAATTLAALVLWTEDRFKSSSLTSANSLAFISSLVGVALSHEEHFRTTQSSLLLPLYLLSKILCDAVRIRTFAMGGFVHSSFFAASCATFAARCLWFATENMSKGWLVKEKNGDASPVSPESTASFLSRSFFGWATPILLRGAKTQLTLDNLDPISEDLDCLALWEHGKVQWEKELARGGKHPLIWTLLKAFPSSVLAPLLPCVIFSLAMIARPQAIHDAILFVESYTTGSTPEPVEHGWGLAAAFFLIYAVYGVAYSWWFLSVNRGATMLRGFLLEAIYRKSLRVHVEVAKDTGSGKAGSMMSLETEKIILRFNNLYDPLSAFIIVLIGLILLYQQIGASFVAAIIGVVIISVATPLLSKGVGPAQTTWQNLTDRRTKLTSSVLRNIVPVKLSAYTKPLGDKIQSIREDEVVACRWYWFQLMKMGTLTNVSASMINLITLGTYSVVTILDPSAPPLTTARMFTVISVATICQPLFNLGQGWASIVSAWTAVQRIEEFLLAEERTDFAAPPASSEKISRDIAFQNASFGRGPDTFLHDLTATVSHGKKTFVIGRVGSGKSTFLHACLAEVDLLGGTLVVPPERTGYCSQDSWLRSESIRSSITFASIYEAAWYQKVVRALALDRDFEDLPDGDLTIATKLSGGQRQRVALARAVYARPTRLVLDDVFSALDANTEQSVYESLFDPKFGLLAGQTVIMVTNGIHRLHESDDIIVLSDGTIAQHGSYDELIATEGLIRDLISEFATDHRTSSSLVAVADEEEDLKQDQKEDKIIRDDEGHRGGTGWAPFAFYLGMVRPHRLFICGITILLSALMPLVVNIYQNYWSASIVQSPRDGLRRFFGGYVGLEFAYFAAFIVGIFYVFCTAAPAASRQMHERLLTGVLGAPLTKLEQGGVGKLLNRFSSDIFQVDFSLPNQIVNVSHLLLTCIGSVVIICVSAPWVALVVLAVILLFTAIQRFYTRTSQQLRRLDLGSKTPLYGLLTDTVNADGIRTVRAFESQDHFGALNTKFVRASQQPYYLMNVSRRWLNSYIGWAVAIINTALVIIAVVSRRSTNAGVFAVALVQATNLTDSLNYLILSWVEAEICIVAVERIKEYAELAPEETRDGDDSAGMRDVWPKRGGILFNNVTARYDSTLEPVLKGLSFKIRAGDRVGIVGRTGSGKSTTLAALFRMVNVDDGGQIMIDGKNIAELSLDTLRQGMTLIPQDPLLLEMSIRDNLDLEGSASDADIWNALEKSSMKAVIEALPLKLDEVVSGSGRFSRGQKQLLALARALLRNRKIVCLDEATSSLDVETDQAIQQTLRSSFGDATIITIAHRVATIQDYDQVLVLDNGTLAEQGSPAELLTLDGGLFRRLVRGDA